MPINFSRCMVPCNAKINFYLKQIQNAKKNSELFSRNILGSYLKVNGNEINILRTNYGKPFLADFPEIHYNIAHSENFIVGVIAEESVGIDIERIRIINKLIVDSIYTKNEKQYISSKKNEVGIRSTKIWTMKEAYLKMLGSGFTLPHKKFDVLALKNKSIFFTSMIYEDQIFTICYRKRFASSVPVKGTLILPGIPVPGKAPKNSTEKDKMKNN